MFKWRNLVYFVCFVFTATSTSYVGSQTFQYIVERGPGITAVSLDLADYFGLLYAGSRCLDTDIVTWCKYRNASKSHIYRGKQIYCGCQCPYEKSTYVHRHGAVDGGCRDNGEVRGVYGGCKIYLKGEDASTPLRVLNLKNRGRIEMESGTLTCTINSVFSYDLHTGEWKNRETANQGSTGIFHFKNKSHQGLYLQWKKEDANKVFTGKIVRLNVSCESSIVPAEESCLIFKVAGLDKYNVSVPTTTPTWSPVSTVDEVSEASTVLMTVTPSGALNSILSTSPPLTNKETTTKVLFSSVPDVFSTSQSLLLSSSSPSINIHPTSVATSTSHTVLSTILQPLLTTEETSSPLTTKETTTTEVLFSSLPNSVFSTSPLTTKGTTTEKTSPTTAFMQPKGKPGKQGSDNTGAIVGAVVAFVVVLIIVLLLIVVFRRRRLQQSHSETNSVPQKKPERDTANNPMYGRRSAEDITLKFYPKHSPNTGSGPRQSTVRSSTDDAADQDYDYAAVDGYQKQNQPPVYQSLNNSNDPKQQIYTSFNKKSPQTEYTPLGKKNNNTFVSPEPVYNVLEGPDQEKQKDTNPNGGSAEPLYKTLEEPRQDHEYRALEPNLNPSSAHQENEPLYNVLEDHDMDYDNAAVDYSDPNGNDVPSHPMSRDNPAYNTVEKLNVDDSLPPNPDYDVLEEPDSTTEEVSPSGIPQSPVYDVLDRPDPVTAGAKNDGPLTDSVYQPLQSSATDEDTYQSLDKAEQPTYQSLYQSLSRKKDGTA